jgi:hypothetical protein
MDIVIGTKLNILELQRGKITVIVFTSAKCKPCIRYLDVVKQYADTCSHDVTIITYDAYEDQEFPRKCKLLDLPSTMVCVDTRVIGRRAGCLKIESLEELVAANLKIIYNK